MSGTERPVAVESREPADRTAVVQRTPLQRIAPVQPTIADDAPSCSLNRFQNWRWQVADSAPPERKLTLFQRVYNWLYDYNRY